MIITISDLEQTMLEAFETIQSDADSGFRLESFNEQEIICKLMDCHGLTIRKAKKIFDDAVDEKVIVMNNDYLETYELNKNK